MNDLESKSLHEHIIRRSVLVLVFKGGLAWCILVLADYVVSQLPAMLDWMYSYNVNVPFLTSEAVENIQGPLHLMVNIFYGAILLYIVLSWVFEYYIIRDDTIVARTGIVFTHENVYQVEDVKTIELYQGFWAKLFGVGTVSFYAYRAQKYVYLRSVDQPRLIAEHIQQLHPVPESLTIASARKPNKLHINHDNV